MARRSDHSREELKELILEKSWKIIEKQGFDGLTARQIAKDIGYAPGTIYNLFNSMDDLYLRLNAQTLDLLYDTLNSAACNQKNKNPVNNMKCMAHMYMSFARKYRSHWLMLFHHRLPEGRKDIDWYQEKIDQLFDPLERHLESYFTAKQTKKKKIAARVLWASVHGLCFLQETGKIGIVDKSNTAEKMSDYLIDNFVKGMKAN